MLIIIVITTYKTCRQSTRVPMRPVWCFSPSTRAYHPDRSTLSPNMITLSCITLCCFKLTLYYHILNVTSMLDSIGSSSPVQLPQRRPSSIKCAQRDRCPLNRTSVCSMLASAWQRHVYMIWRHMSVRPEFQYDNRGSQTDSYSQVQKWILSVGIVSPAVRHATAEGEAVVRHAATHTSPSELTRDMR